MEFWCHFFLIFACTSLTICIANGAVENSKVNSNLSGLHTMDRFLSNATILGNSESYTLKNTFENMEAHTEEDSSNDKQLDNIKQDYEITHVRLKRAYNPTHNRGNSAFLETSNIPTIELKAQSKIEENFIQVPNKGGRLEKIKREHLSSNTNEKEVIPYSNQGGSNDKRNRKHGYESVIDPNSGYHIISEREDNHSGESNEKHDELLTANKNTHFDNYRPQVEAIQNIKINANPNPGRQTLANIDTDTVKGGYSSKKQSVSQDSKYLENSSFMKRIEPVVENRDLKDSGSNINGDYGRRTGLISEVNSYAHESENRDQLSHPVSSKDQESYIYQKHEPRSNFDSKNPNLEIEIKNSNMQRFVEEDYIKGHKEASLNLDDNKEHEFTESGIAEKEKYPNVASEIAAYQESSQGYRPEQQLQNKGVVPSEYDVSIPNLHYGDQQLQKRGFKYPSQQLQYNNFEDTAQHEDQGYTQNNAPEGSSYYQANVNNEIKKPIPNFEYVPQVPNHHSIYFEQHESNQDSDIKVQEQPNTGSSHNEQQIHNYGFEQLPLHKNAATQDHPQSSPNVPNKIFESIIDDSNLERGTSQIGNKHHESYNFSPIHNSRSVGYPQQYVQHQEYPPIKPENQNIYDIDTGKKATATMSFSLSGPPKMKSRHKNENI